MRTLTELSRRLAAGEVSSRELVEQYLARMDEPDGEGRRAFLAVYRERALAEADRADQARRAGWDVALLTGIPISIKDLFDIAGEKTRAGSHVLDEQPPASVDAPTMAYLRRAGLILIGKCNMTEFAYSGLGINGHFDTPRAPFEREVNGGRIPGGSTSGGAVSVADAMAAATIGTDTGGSCRIPAAFCSIVGFKPTSTRVSRAGAVPLSSTMDSIGPLANSVSCCAILDSLLRGGVGDDVRPMPAAGVRLGVLQGYVLRELDDEVARTFDAALERLSAAGVVLTPVTINELDELPTINARGGIVGAEAYAWHRQLLETRSEYYDPWIRSRFDGGRAQSAADYIDVVNHRQRIRAAAAVASAPFDALVLPTVAIVPPRLSELVGDENLAASNKANLLCLRNTAVGNFLDSPSISLPCNEPDQAPVGLMLMGQTGTDSKVLALAKGLEEVVRL